MVFVHERMTYGSLLLLGNGRHAQVSRQQSQHSLLRIKVSLVLEIAFLPYGSLDCPLDKAFIEKGEPHFSSPMCHSSVISSKIPLSKTPYIQPQLFNKPWISSMRISNTVSSISAEEFISTESREKDTASCAIWLSIRLWLGLAISFASRCKVQSAGNGKIHLSIVWMY